MESAGDLLISIVTSQFSTQHNGPVSHLHPAGDGAAHGRGRKVDPAGTGRHAGMIGRGEEEVQSFVRGIIYMQRSLSGVDSVRF